jgi:hypothetical protein
MTEKQLSYTVYWILQTIGFILFVIGFYFLSDYKIPIFKAIMIFILFDISGGISWSLPSPWDLGKKPMPWER